MAARRFLYAPVLHSWRRYATVTSHEIANIKLEKSQRRLSTALASKKPLVRRNQRKTLTFPVGDLPRQRRVHAHFPAHSGPKTCAARLDGYPAQRGFFRKIIF
jgi:hypothetical protein